MVELADELLFQIKDNKLTPEILCKFSGCEHYTNTQALNIIVSLEKLAVISFNIDCNKIEKKVKAC